MMQVWEADLGFPRPLMNREVLDLSGRVIAVVDLLEEQSGTYGEYNGASHRQSARARALWLPEDRRRWRLGGFVPAPPLPDADETAFEALMLEHYRSLE